MTNQTIQGTKAPKMTAEAFLRQIVRGYQEPSDRAHTPSPASQDVSRYALMTFIMPKQEATYAGLTEAERRREIAKIFPVVAEKLVSGTNHLMKVMINSDRQKLTSILNDKERVESFIAYTDEAATLIAQEPVNRVFITPEEIIAKANAAVKKRFASNTRPAPKGKTTPTNESNLH